MPGVRLTQFYGILPRTESRDRPFSYAEIAHDVNLHHGRIEPIHDHSAKCSIGVGIEALSAYDLPECGCYLMWAEDVSVAEPNIQDCERRIYYTGDGEFKVATATMACNEQSRKVGVPYPNGAASVGTRGGDGSCATGGGLLYTYVNSLGEESVPSPVASVSYNAGATVSGSVPPGNDTGYFPIVETRVYLGISSPSAARGEASADFLLLDVINGNGGNYSGIAEGQGKAVTSWRHFLPPDDLQNVCLAPNGMLCGNVGRVIHFSYPHMYNAWPTEFNITVRDEVVAIVATGREVYVLTTGRPNRIGFQNIPDIGYVPSFYEYPHPLPCVAKFSAEASHFGCVYMSNIGIIGLVDTERPDVLSTQYFEEDDWLAIKPETGRAVVHNGAYYMTTDEGTWRFQFDDGIHDQRPAFMGLTTYSVMPNRWFVDRKNVLHFLFSNTAWRFNDPAMDVLEYHYRTKIYVHRGLSVPAGVKVVKNTDDANPIAVQFFSDPDSRQEYELIHEMEVIDAEPYRLPSLYLGLNFVLDVIGTDIIHEIHLASSYHELAETEEIHAFRNSQQRNLGS